MLVAEEDLRTVFHPIVSIPDRKVWAVEALSRAHDPLRNRTVSPNVLFRVAEEVDRLAEFDRFCRRRAAERYAMDVPSTDETLLSVNWDSRCLAAFLADPDQLPRLIDRLGLERSQVILEILESNVEDTRALARFAEARRREGFLIAIDDFGTGYSSLERIALIEPDIIKIDRFLVQGIATGHHKQEACRAVVDMARHLGCLVVAEGIEQESDLLAAVNVGVDFIQGFYFGEPCEDYAVGKALAEAKLAEAAQRVAEDKRASISDLRSRLEREQALFENLLASVCATTLDGFDEALRGALLSVPDVEAAYVLDEHGIQVTTTHTRASDDLPWRARAFRPARRGADQSLKEYYLAPRLGMPHYASRPYVSMATGRLCSTHSRFFRGTDGVRYLLCCDVPATRR